MLTEHEKNEITSELRHCEWKDSASVEALKIVQKQRGWVSDESLREIAAMLEMAPAEVDAVATFYSFIFRKPVGRHIIQLCDSMACWTLGLNPLLERLTKTLGIAYGETTPDSRFTLLPVSCLGACDRAPAVLVDEDLYGPVDPDSIEEILMKYL